MMKIWDVASSTSSVNIIVIEIIKYEFMINELFRKYTRMNSVQMFIYWGNLNVLFGHINSKHYGVTND